MFLLIRGCVLPLALTNDIPFLLSEVCSVWNHQFEVEVRNHAEPRCWWRNKVQTVWGLNLLCATDYFGYGKGAKLPDKSHFPLWAVRRRYLQPPLRDAAAVCRDACLLYGSPLTTVNNLYFQCWNCWKCIQMRTRPSIFFSTMREKYFLSLQENLPTVVLSACCLSFVC